MHMYRLIALSLVVLVGCGGEDEPASSAAELSAALAGAGAGDTVRASAGTFRGIFVVPDGVTLVGAGDGTILESAGDEAVVMLRATSSETTVRNLTVRSTGTAAVIATGAGTATVDTVRVESTRGIGIGGEDAGTFRLVDVTLIGPVTPDNVSELPLDPTPADTATHGIVLVRVADAELLRVTVNGYAKFGALFVESGVDWDTGNANENVSTGLMSYGGSATLTGVEVARTIGGFTLIPPYNAVFANGSVVSTTNLVASGGEGYGVLHSGTGGSHVGLIAEDNTAAGLWAQDTAGLALSGASGRIANNAFAGLVALDSSDVTVEDIAVTDTRMARRVFGETSTVEVGDGIQLVRSTTAITLRNVTLTNNQRAGTLIDLGGSTIDGVSLESVTANATGTSLGVVAQNGTLTAGWDSMVTRMGDTATNDPSFLTAGSILDIAGVVAPTDMPAADDISSGGLGAVGVVAPTD